MSCRTYDNFYISKIVDQYSSNSCVPTSFCITFATRITKKDLFKHSASFALKISINKQTSKNAVFSHSFFVK